MEIEDVVLILIAGPPLWILCGILGRLAMRRTLGMNFPYEERIRRLNDGRLSRGSGGGSMAVPRIPKGKGWF